MDSLRLRVQFTKIDRARFLSHTEFFRTVMLSARRAGLPLEYAGRFRPRMKISLSPPLPIGVTSECELVDFSLSEYVSPVEAEKSLSSSLPPGIEVRKCRLMGRDSKPVGRLIDTALWKVEIPEDLAREGDWGGAVEEFLVREEVVFERVQPRRTRAVDLRPGVHRLELELPEGGPSRLAMALDDGTAGTVKPMEVIEVLGELAGCEGSCGRVRVHREGLFARRGRKLVSPMDMGRRKPAV